MAKEIDEFIDYLTDTKNMSENTVLSYRRDLNKLQAYCKSLAIREVNQISATNLQSYLMYLEAGSFKAATISRSVASIHAFFRYLYVEHKVDSDVSEGLQAPKVEKKVPEILTEEEVQALLSQPKGRDPKSVRDKAMLELLYATGIRVSELITLTVSDVDLKKGMLSCAGRMIPFDEHTRRSLMDYLEESREELLAGNVSDVLFPNCSGSGMSRQGFWKLLKGYGKKAGIQKEIAPHTLRHSFAAHLLAGGADVSSVSQMLGHSDVSTTLVYTHIAGNPMRDTYSGARKAVLK